MRRWWCADERADALGDRRQLLDAHGRAELRTGHPRDGLLHQRAAQVVRAAVEHHLRALDAELDPAGLDMRDPAVQHDPRQRVDGAVVTVGRARARPAGQIQRRGLMHERQRHELGETAGLVLDTAQHAQVPHPVPRRVDVAVHHR